MPPNPKLKAFLDDASLCTLTLSMPIFDSPEGFPICPYHLYQPHLSKNNTQITNLSGIEALVFTHLLNKAKITVKNSVTLPYKMDLLQSALPHLERWWLALSIMPLARAQANPQYFQTLALNPDHPRLPNRIFFDALARYYPTNPKQIKILDARMHEL